MTSLTKNPHPNQTFFFEYRLAKSFGSLKSCLAQLAEELWRWRGNRKLLVLG